MAVGTRTSRRRVREAAGLVTVVGLLLVLSDYVDPPEPAA